MDLLLSFTIAVFIPVGADTSALWRSSNVHTAVRTSILEDLFGDLDIIGTVLDYLIYFTRFIPFGRLESVTAFFHPEGGRSDIIQSESSSRCLAYVVEHVKYRKISHIAILVCLKHGEIVADDIVSYHVGCSFEMGE